MRNFNAKPRTAPLAAEVYAAKDKRDGTVELRRRDFYRYTWEGAVSSANPSLEMLLRIEVTSTRGFHGPSQLNTDFHKNFFFELIARKNSEPFYVIQCHCQEDDHGSGKVHIHRASPNSRNKGRVDSPWHGVNHKTPIGEAFLSAMAQMGIDAQLQQIG